MVTPPSTQSRVRLGEVIGCLSLVTDMATGQPLEHGLRRTLLAVWLGDSLGLGGEQLNKIYYVAQLGSVGCALEVAELAPLVGDEISLEEQIARLDSSSPLQMTGLLFRHVGAGEPLRPRLSKLATAVRKGAAPFETVCRDVAMRVGDMIDIGLPVRQALGQCHERWDGKGGPQGLEGDDVDIAARIFRVAHHADIFNRIGGVDAVRTVMQERSGSMYDPLIAGRCRERARDLLARLETDGTWEGLLSVEPAPQRWISQREVDSLAETLANYVDLRSAYTLGHSVGVAALAESTARHLGLSESEAATVQRAGLLHDMGRARVPVTLWDKSRPLTEGEWEQLKRHPSLTEHVLTRSCVFGPLGNLAGLHHERLDGSGYRGLPASFLSTGAMVLAAADAYKTKTEPRPHRGALDSDAAALEVKRQAREGQFDMDVVNALLCALGRLAPPQANELPSGLSERELEVLQLVVRGLSNRQIAEALVISHKTVGHHIQHIYDKAGVSTRVGATLFALHHGLVQEDL